MTLSNGPIGQPRGAAEAPAPSGGSRLRWLLLGMVSLTLLLGAVFGRHGLLEARQYRLERDRLKAEIQELQRRNAELERELERLKSDPLAVERVAREELGLARPDEKVILLQPPERHDQPIVSTAPGLDETPSRP